MDRKNIIKYVVLFLIALVIVFFIRLFTSDRYRYESINISKYENIIKENKINYIYITSDEYNIEDFENILLNNFKEKKKVIYKFDITNKDNFDYLFSNEKIQNYFNNELMLPVLIVTKNNEIISSINYEGEEKVIEELNRIEEL